MIVYNVKRRWFTMKNDAEAYRKVEKLPPVALYTLKVDDRDGLASLLNNLCGVYEGGPTDPPHPAPVEVIERNAVNRDIYVPDFIPAFLLKDKH